MSRKNYDMSELEVFASDCQELAEKIDASIASATFDKKRPYKGTWDEIEKKQDAAANTLFQIWHDIEGDQ